MDPTFIDRVVLDQRRAEIRLGDRDTAHVADRAGDLERGPVAPLRVGELIALVLAPPDVHVPQDETDAIADALADLIRARVRGGGVGEPTLTVVDDTDVVVQGGLADQIAEARVQPQASLLIRERLFEMALVPVDGAEVLQRLRQRLVVAGALGGVDGAFELRRRLVVRTSPPADLPEGDEGPGPF